MHAEQQRRLGPDRALVVGGARAVRRPDLDEARAGAREHVGDAEAVADLDQLAARDDDLATLGERGEREQHRGGVVVDDERRLGAGQPAEQRRDVVLARAARARREVVLEVRVAGWRPRTRSSAASASGARPRFVWTITPVALSTRRSAGRRAAASSRARRSPQVARLGAGVDLLARPLEHGRAAVATASGSSTLAHQLVDRRQVAQPHETSVSRRSGYFANRETRGSDRGCLARCARRRGSRGRGRTRCGLLGEAAAGRRARARSTSTGACRSSWPASVRRQARRGADGRRHGRRKPRSCRPATIRSASASGSWSTRARRCSRSTRCCRAARPRRPSPSGLARARRSPGAPRSSPAAARSRSSRRGPATPSTSSASRPRSSRRRAAARGRVSPRR